MNLEKNSIARRYVYGKQTANKNKKVVLSVFSGFDKKSLAHGKENK